MSASLIVQTRFARPQIMMNGADFYATLAPYLLSFEYTDSCDGEKGDSISIELDDRDGRFIGPDHPQKGAFFDCSIACVNWRAPGDNVSLECGRFWIDDVSFSGPPDVLTIKANSIPTDSKVKAKQSTRAWENTDLKKVADQIAGESQMSVKWEGEDSPQFKRLEQTESSDLAFLKKKAKDCGLSIKVSKRQIIFFDEQKYEEKPPSFTLAKGNPATVPDLVPMRSYHFSTKFTDTAKSATVSYVNPETGRLTKETAEAPEAMGYADGYKGELTINENPGYMPDQGGGGGSARELDDVLVPFAHQPTDYVTPNYKDPSPSKNRGKGAGGNKVAKRKAKKELRDKNKEATKAGDKSNTFGIEIFGWPLIAAGQTCMVQGFGFYDGKYFVVSARHKVGGEYETSLSIRKCLEGY